MPNVEVSCTVSNCIFHAKGNICGAEKIQVEMENPRINNTEFASDFDIRTVSEKAKHSSDTCCKTFISKENHRD